MYTHGAQRFIISFHQNQYLNNWMLIQRFGDTLAWKKGWQHPTISASAVLPPWPCSLSNCCWVFLWLSKPQKWNHYGKFLVLGRSRKKCTSVPPKALFGKTIGSTPKMPLKIFLYWSDCVDTNCWPQSRQGPNIQELKCLTQSPFIHYITENINYLT